MLRVVMLTVGVALLVFLLWRLGPTDILDLIGRIRWALVPILGLYTGHHAARALALRACVLPPRTLGFRDALAIRLSGEAVQSLTFSGPVLAEPTRAWLLTRRGLTLQEGFAATITEYLISSFVTAALSVVALVYVVRRFEPPPLVAAIAVAVVIVFGAFLIASAVAISRRFYLIGTVLASLARLGVLRGRLRPDMMWINRMEDLLLAILRDRPRRFLTAALLDVAAQALLVVELFWLLNALDVAAPWLFPLLIEASVKVIGIAFFFVPLQMGTAEGTYAVVFDVIGLPAAAGFALAFVRRVRSLAVASIGLALLARLTQGARLAQRSGASERGV